ncbi:MAG: hypothetical protein IPG08_16170 [Sphingobacteriaceae bacterium]|nr:hypothetical protein [Sphingobacteriaceae bacterium]
MRSFNFIFSVMVGAAITLTSCHKKETVEVDNETQSVVDNAVAEQEFMSMVPAVNSVAIKTKGTGADPNKSAVVACDSLHIVSGDTLWSSPTHVHPTYSLTLAGSSSCSPIPDSKLREGIMFITFYGKVKTAGSRMKIVLAGYKAANTDPAKKISYQCDSIVVKTVSNNPTTDIRIFNVKIYNGKCVGPTNNWTTLYSTDRTITHNMATDEISIYGTSNGTNRLNRTFTVDVPQSSPLVKKASCQFISSGILNLTPDGFKTRTVDYGNGNCDDDATFSVNGNTVAFKLK